MNVKSVYCLVLVLSFLFISCRSNNSKIDKQELQTKGKEYLPSQGHQHQHEKGDMNRKFMDPKMNLGKWKEDFESLSRDVYKHKSKIVEALEIKPGDHVADIGAGTGAFLSALNSKVANKGKVYAVEISPKFVEFMKKRVQLENLSSVEVVLGTPNSSNLKSSTVDTVLLVNVYHHLDKTETMLNDFQRILKKTGKLVIVDFDRRPGISSEWIMKHTRLTEKEHIEEIENYGFTFVKKVEIPFKDNFMLIFKKVN
jgi:ubiquinone/menaquinone biosynthesis C-methylase UbiE